jgi:hypothetical protein
MKGGSCESAAALRATRRRDLRRLRGRMMYATVPAKSAKSTTTTTDTASGVIFWGPADASMISSAFAPQVESVGVPPFWQDALAMTQKRPAGVSGARRKACVPRCEGWGYVATWMTAPDGVSFIRTLCGLK